MRSKVSILILQKHNKFLVGQRREDRKLDPSAYAFPGGHIKNGETPEKAIVREVEEELGVTLVNPKLIYVTNFDGPQEKQKLYFYHCTEYKGKIQKKEDSKLVWISKNEIDLLTFSVSRTALKKSSKTAVCDLLYLSSPRPAGHPKSLGEIRKIVKILIKSRCCFMKTLRIIAS